MDTIISKENFLSPSPRGYGRTGSINAIMKELNGNEISITVTPSPDVNQNSLSLPESRRMTGDNTTCNELVVASRRPSSIENGVRRPSNVMMTQRRLMMEFLAGNIDSKQSLSNLSNLNNINAKDNYFANAYKMKNRRLGNDSLTTALSALYAKVIIVLGMSLPVTDILSLRAPPSFYQGFYLYLYLGSVSFVAFMYVAHLRSRAVFTILSDYHNHQGDKISSLGIKKRVVRYGSFYLRVGAIAFGIGSMVYSGIEFGQYFELKKDSGCQNVLIALTPAARMVLSIVQMQFLFLNTKEFEMSRHKVISRFGLMHMIATNLCEWLYVLVEETKHEIIHLAHILHENHGHTTLNNSIILNNLTTTNNNTLSLLHHQTKRATALEIVVECRRTNIMGTLVQNASPFLFPCTIEYSLICAVILFEMWKKIRSLSDIQRSRRNSKKALHNKNHHYLSVDCSRAHRGMFAGILVIVLTIISLIMYFVLVEEVDYKQLAGFEVTITEILLYLLTSTAVLAAMFRMRDLKYSKKYGETGIGLDCTLLLLAQVGVYIYCMFSIIGCHFAYQDEKNDEYGSIHGLIAEVFSLLQTSLQTIFILNAWWRRCKGSQQNRQKPGREIITFLLVANMAVWFLNTLIKSRASFRPTHLTFFGTWAWTIITHVSMPLAIFYRFHSTICLFEIWKTTYKFKKENN